MNAMGVMAEVEMDFYHGIKLELRIEQTDFT